MRICTLACAAAIAAAPASAREEGLGIRLLPGHPVYHESEKEAGVAMALIITPGQDRATDLRGLCEELRLAAGLGNENGDGLRLQVIFVVPHKGMALEGYYLPEDESSEAAAALVLGRNVTRATLDSIVAQAGIPPRVLDETNVEHEISCGTSRPLWSIDWLDVRRIGDEDPDAVIERAHQRFMAVHQAVLEHNTEERYLQKARASLPSMD